MLLWDNFFVTVNNKNKKAGVVMLKVMKQSDQKSHR